jgi:hypothetical protein
MNPRYRALAAVLFTLTAAGLLQGCGCSGGTILEGDAWNDNFQCVERDITLTPVVPEVLIMLDRSNSMEYDGFWDPTRSAVSSAVETYQSEVMFGLVGFPGEECTSLDTSRDCDASESPLVAMKFEAGDAVSSALMGLAPCGGTPVAETLLNMRDYLLSRPRDNPRYILMATDGAPNCNTSLDGYTCRCTCFDETECGLCDRLNSNCLDDVRTYAALDELLEDNIRTFVIGLSTAAVDWGDVLHAMAVHGGTGTFYAAESPDQVAEIFDDITSLVSHCEFYIEPSEVPDDRLVNLYFDGMVVQMDPDGMTGWNWTGDDSLEFYGASCQRIVSSEVDEITATYGCPTVTIDD